MEFEFDAEKSRSNLEKHGIDFAEVQRLWEDPKRVEVPAKTQDEPRTIVIGAKDGKLWSVVISPRSSRVRIISARRSRREEVHIYESP